jgi:3-oxoadipate enol-lactonase
MPTKLIVNGCELKVERRGKDGAPVILFSNSLGSDLAMWDEQVTILERNFQVVCMDTRGHGASSSPAGDYSLNSLADDVLAVMDKLNIERAHFVGLSLGGMIGQVLGARSGDRFDSLTLCATFSETDRMLWADRVDVVRASGVEHLVESTIERWFTPAFRESSPEVIDKVRKMIIGTSTNGYAGCSAAIRDMDLTGIPEQIRIPTLVIAATQDPSATPEAMKKLHSRIPDAHYTEINNAAHLFTLEQPQAATDLIQTFLHEVEFSAKSVPARGR